MIDQSPLGVVTRKEKGEEMGMQLQLPSEKKV